MRIKTIPLGNLEINLTKTLSECAETGDVAIVEMPDQSLLAIQSLEPDEDENLLDELLATNPKFQALVEKSKSGTRKPFAF